MVGMPQAYLSAIPGALIDEIHLAGHSEMQLPSGKKILVDTHDREVAAPVWALYEAAIKVWGEIPTLIEWDAKIPSWQVLEAQAQLAAFYLNPKQDVKYA